MGLKPQRREQTTRAPISPQSFSTSGAFGQQIGQAVEQLGATVSDAALDRLEKQKRIDDATFALETDTASREKWTREIEERRKNAAPGEQLRDTVLADFDQDAKDQLENAPSAEARLRTQGRLASYRNALLDDITRSDATAQATRIKTAAGDAIQIGANQILSDPRKFGEVRQKIANDLAEISATLPKEARDALLDHGDEQAAIAFGEGMIPVDPDGFLEVLNSGKLDDSLSLANKTRLLIKARSEIESREKAIIAGRAKELAAKNVQLAVVGQYNLDPRNTLEKKALDAFYFGDFLEGIEGQPQAVQDTLKVGLVQRVGIMPETMRAEVRGVLQSSQDVNEIARVSNMVDEINLNAPEALADMNQKDIEKAVWINNSVAAGVSPADAVNGYDEMTKIDDRVVKVRVTDAAQSKPFKNAGDNIADTFDTLFGFEPAVPDLAVAEYRTLYEQSFVRHGDEDVAAQTAMSQIKTTWGVSGLGVRKEVMKLAPEKIYGRFGGGGADTEWMHEQLIDDLSTGAVWAKGWEKAVFVQPDNATSRTGDYPVLIKRGEVIDQLRDGDNQILRWRPDWRTSQPGVAQAERNAEGTENSAFHRQMWIKRQRGEISVEEYMDTMDVDIRGAIGGPL